jgi:hypothetical protein
MNSLCKLKPELVALRYCDGMKGGTVSLLYNLLLELDKYYSKNVCVFYCHLKTYCGPSSETMQSPE